MAPGSKIASVKDADAEGVGIGGVANTATFRAAKKATPKATHIDFAGVDAAVAAMNANKIQAIALSRESLSGLAGKIAGSRILDDAFLNSSTAVCVPKGKPAALAYVSEFIEEAKASGLVRQALDEMGLTRRSRAGGDEAASSRTYFYPLPARGEGNLRRAHMLRPHAEADDARRQALQQRKPVQQLGRERRAAAARCPQAPRSAHCSGSAPAATG